jgi:hypothetical protein
MNVDDGNLFADFLFLEGARPPSGWPRATTT